MSKNRTNEFDINAAFQAIDEQHRSVANRYSAAIIADVAEDNVTAFTAAGDA